MHDRYSAISYFSARSKVLNREVRCISRVVVHPQWRGLGLAVRLVMASLADPPTICTEALAAMGQAHHFFQKSGMTEYHRPPHVFDLRMRDALAEVGIYPVRLAMIEQMLGRIEVLPIRVPSLAATRTETFVSSCDAISP